MVIYQYFPEKRHIINTSLQKVLKTMDHLISKSHLFHLPLFIAACLLPGSLAQIPRGCGTNVSSLYYNLCDLDAVWGVVLESFTSAGVVVALILIIVLLASLPFVKDKKWRSALGLHVIFLIFTFGLFGLTFAFIIGKDFATCATRRFLFGVLFAGCFSCLIMQAVRLNILARRNSAPRFWVWFLGFLGLWLVEVIINTEWLIITIVRYPINGNQTAATPVPCNIDNQDFVMALIYVLVLLLVVVVASIPILAGKHKRWRKDGALILVIGLLSVGIWVAWIVMYVYGNKKHGGPTWDDPTLAIALVSNAWVFLLLHTIPGACSMNDDDEEKDTAIDEDLYPSRGYETVLKEQSSQSIYVENKAFTMDEPNTGNKPVSPYNGYNGTPLRSGVYQPTELAFITKGAVNGESYDRIPRASMGTSLQDPNGHTNPSTQTYSNGNFQQRHQ